MKNIFVIGASHTVRSMLRNFTALVGLALCVTTVASAARFPDAVEKKVTLHGDPAVAVAKLLGLPIEGKSSLRLPLGQGDSWAVYLLKDDLPRKLLNSDDGMPERFNEIKFSPGPGPSISIGSFWLDQGQALPDSQPGVFSFSSPWISPADTERSVWGRLVNALREVSTSKGSNPNNWYGVTPAPSTAQNMAEPSFHHNS